MNKNVTFLFRLINKVGINKRLDSYLTAYTNPSIPYTIPDDISDGKSTFEHFI